MGLTDRIIAFFLDNKLIATLLLLALVGWGVATAPFDWDMDLIPRDPVPVDAIPDIGENQQIVFTEWEGRSPQDVEDQITYPLTTELLGLPGVEAVRSSSMFGFSSINIIFEENIEFYWSRTRILEKLNALPDGTLPEGVQPTLGPDATGLGQIFWYTLEGMDEDGNPTGGWDLHELRSIQDFQVRYGLSSAKGVAEVSSIGGHVQEYQVDIDPTLMREQGVSVRDIASAVQKSNRDVGARTLEMNRAEYVVRGRGYIQNLSDLEESVVDVREGTTPVRIRDVARVSLGPAQRRGMLDKAGAEAVGGVVVARYGENPLEVIQNVNEKIEELQAGMPSKTLADGTVSTVQIVPFYDRTGLIYETLGTLEEALSLQILITIIVIMVMVMHLRASFIVSALLPVAVLMSFIMMRYVGVDANVVALAGIAISIGTVVDMGIIMTENMLRHLDEALEGESLRGVIFEAASEVSPAVITALTTTIVSFLPVFMLQASEGRLFGPLAWTKTFVLVAALILTIALIPPFAHWLFTRTMGADRWQILRNGALVIAGLALFFYMPWAGLVLLGLGILNLAVQFADQQTVVPPEQLRRWHPWLAVGIIVLGISWLLADLWLPLGPENPIVASALFVILAVVIVLGSFLIFQHYYEPMLRYFLEHKALFLSIPLVLLFVALLSWRGFDSTMQPVSWPLQQVGVDVTETGPWQAASDRFPGLDREFMPTLDEGSFLLMPTTMPHAGMEEAVEQVRIMDMRVASIPEVETVVGKIGRVESALDPAPISMFENVIQYKSEYKTDERGRRVRFAVDNDGSFKRDEAGDLIPDRRGRYYRQWRDHIQSSDDIWQEILQAADMPGVTSAPRLQPIETRLVMLQTGMRANIGVQVFGPDIDTIDEVSIALEDILRGVDGIRSGSVYADRMAGKPYIELDINRQAIARHGLTIDDVQEVISIAIGGRTLTTTVEGRERYPVRVRYARETRNTPEMIARILVPAANGTQIPLGQLVDIAYVEGPMNIRSEDTFPVNYVTFDNVPGTSSVEAAENARDAIAEARANGQLQVPDGVTFRLAGEFEDQQRASERLALIIPITLLIIFLLIYFQFRSTTTALIILSAIALAWTGGFILLWLYGQDWFLNFAILGTELQGLFQVEAINLSVAVWVGFLALFGIAVDNSVVLATYLKQLFDRDDPTTLAELRETVVTAGMRRVRPCLMTTGTTLLALLPILTAPGKGGEIMVPMAVPIFGGMLVQVLSLFLVPVLYALWKEWQLNNLEEATT